MILAQQKKARDAKSPIRTIKCSECPEMISTKYNRKTCSPECAKKRKNRMGHESYEANKEAISKRDKEKRKRKPRVPKIRQCVVCGKDFVVASGKENTCSPECRHERSLVMQRARYRSDHGVPETAYRR
jgi:hypothetical protein